MKVIDKIKDFDVNKSYSHLSLNSKKVPIYASDTKFTCSCEFGYNCDDPNFEPITHIIGYREIKETN